jgi:hypothetical protein
VVFLLFRSEFSEFLRESAKGGTCAEIPPQFYTNFRSHKNFLCEDYKKVLFFAYFRLILRKFWHTIRGERIPKEETEAQKVPEG